MTLRPIVRLGHPSLRTPADPVEPGEIPGADFQTLVDDMVETMNDANGVGLAAPQVAVGKQLFVYRAVGPHGDIEEPENKVLINPMVEPVPGEVLYDWEGCLSIPDLRGLVPRHPAVRVYALDRDGQSLSLTVEGYEARIIQHEFDHLNGVIFLDRMRDLRSLAYGDEWERYMTTADEHEAQVG